MVRLRKRTWKVNRLKNWPWFHFRYWTYYALKISVWKCYSWLAYFCVECIWSNKENCLLLIHYKKQTIGNKRWLQRLAGYKNMERRGILKKFERGWTGRSESRRRWTTFYAEFFTFRQTLAWKILQNSRLHERYFQISRFLLIILYFSK